MHELQSEDCYIPAFLLKLLPQTEKARKETFTEDFLKGIQAWSDYDPVDECFDG